MRRRDGAQDSARFEGCYTAHYQAVAGYVGRRVAPDEADDVIAQVFLAAWRRLEQVPAPPQDRLWLFGVARKAIADHHRSRQRRRRLGARLAGDAATVPVLPADPDPRCEDVLAAMTALRPAEQEALRLVLWDELTHAEAAELLGCSVNAFELRYRRARNAVRDAVSVAAPRPAKSPAPIRQPVPQEVRHEY
jgi:RNA polymerase sigma factor (sigma-70 family)